MNDTQPAPPPVPKKHGCFFYGCIISLSVFCVVVLIGFLAVRFTLNTFHQMVTDYTQTTPAQLPAEELPPAELKQLHERIAGFDSAVKSHTNTPPLVLTARDINGLIAENPQLKEKCYVTIDNDKIKGQISFPLDLIANQPGIKMFHLNGRYLNGSATFRASIHSGKLFVYIDSLEANGKPAPETFMSTFRQQNMADSVNDGTNADAFANYDSLQVTNDTIIVKAKEQ